MGYFVKSGRTMRYLVFYSLLFHFGRSELFETLPRSQYVPEGQPVLLECQISSAAASASLYEYSWTRNGSTIVHRKMVAASTPMDLFIQEYRPATDSGSYVCTVTDLSTGARLSTPAASLNVLKYLSASIQVMEQLRTSVTLFCDVKTTANEPMFSNITWFRNQHEVKNDDRFHANNFKLHVRTYLNHKEKQETTDRKPAGLVRCGAHSARAGMIFSKSFDLDALFDRIENKVQKRKRPGAGDRHQKRSNDSPRRILTYTEDQIVLNCRLSVSGTDFVEWTRDGKGFRTSKDENPGDGRIAVDRDSGSLHISRSAMGDDGVYQCQSVDTESGGVIQRGASYEVSVRYKLKFTPTPTSKKLELGLAGKVHCKAQGTPWPEIKWFRGVDGELDAELMEDFNGTLHFKNVTKATAGNYTCVAENPEGKLTATINIQVVKMPQFLVAPIGPVLARENETVILHCQATGDPLPTIQWDKDLEYLTYNSSSLFGEEGERVQIYENGTLVIREVRGEDEGKYGCTIGNSGGLKREEIYITIKEAALSGEEEDSKFTVTKALLVTVALTTAYIVFVVLLMMWCRYKKRVLQDNCGDDAEAGLTENKGNELDPFVTNSTSRDCAVSMNGGIGGGGGGKKVHFNVDHFTIDRASVTDSVVIGRGEFGDVSVGKMTVKDIRAVRSAVEKDLGKMNTSIVVGNGQITAATNNDNGDLVGNGKTNGDVVTKNGGLEIEVDTAAAGEVVTGNGTAVADQEKKQVLIKTLTKQKDESLKESFQKQMELLGSVHHRNVTRLYGVSLNKQPWMLVIEYTDWGDLKQFILATAPQKQAETGKKMPPLTVAQTLTLAQQISRGMDALTKAGFVHGDLATRNCIISSVFVAKVSIPGLCRDKYAAEYHRLKDQQRLLPVRWMAPELLCREGGGDGEPSLKTDVWSYGVCVWELFNQAVELPYAQLSNDEFVDRLKGGEIKEDMALKMPDKCPSGLRELLEKCWSKEAAERPSFGQLTTALLAKLKEEKSGGVVAEGEK